MMSWIFQSIRPTSEKAPNKSQLILTINLKLNNQNIQDLTNKLQINMIVGKVLSLRTHLTIKIQIILGGIKNRSSKIQALT
jgi:hypothetical protein